jgi:hypothetical protein
MTPVSGAPAGGAPTDTPADTLLRPSGGAVPPVGLEPTLDGF